MPKLKKVKSGKIKRHKLRKKLGVKQGFGKPWSAKSLAFRVEFCWCDEDEEETNEQVHWIECRKFEGQEYQFLRTFFSKMDWDERETLFSKYVCFYVADFLVRKKDESHLNQAFIFPQAKKGSEAIRVPLYQIKWTESLAENCKFDERSQIVLKNAIWHKY